MVQHKTTSTTGRFTSKTSKVYRGSKAMVTKVKGDVKSKAQAQKEVRALVRKAQVHKDVHVPVRKEKRVLHKIGTVRLKKSGGSLLTIIPVAAKNMLNLAEGQEMSVSVEDGRVIMESIQPETPKRHVRHPRYTLDALLEGYERNTMSDEEKEFHDAEPVGREVW